MKNKAWIYFSTSGTSLICVVLGCVSGILAARLLKVEGRGELAAIAYFPGLMAAFFPLAMPQALTFFISKEPHRREEIAAAGFRISLLFGIAGAATIAFLSKYTLTAENQHLAGSIALVCLMAPAMVVNPHLYAIHRGVQRFSLVNGLLISTTAGYILVLAVLGLTNNVSAFNVAVGAQCLQIAIAIISGWCIGSCLFKTRVKWPTYRLCLLQGLKFWLPALALTLFTISDRAILIRTTTLEQMGYYAAAFAVGFPFSLVSEGFAQIGFVEISGANNKQIASDLLARRFQMVQVVALCAVLAGLPLIHPVIRYGFGKEFTAAVPVAYLVVIAMALRGLSWTLECSLRAKNLILPGIAANLMSFGFLIFFAALLVPSGNAKGFGIALLLAQSIGLVVMVVAAKRALGIPFSQLYGVRPAIIAVLSKNLVSLVKLRQTDAHSYNTATSQL
jgi:O-antigen/teichoic acid export membrane protein